MDSPLGQTRSLACQETLPSLCGPATPAWDSGAESRQELAGAGRPGRDGHLLGCHDPGQLGPLPETVSAGAGARAGLGQRAGPCQLKSGQSKNQSLRSLQVRFFSTPSLSPSPCLSLSVCLSLLNTYTHTHTHTHTYVTQRCLVQSRGLINACCIDLTEDLPWNLCARSLLLPGRER